MKTQRIRIRPALCLAGLFLFTGAAQAQLTNVSLSPSSGNSASGVAQTFTAIFDDSLEVGYIADTYVNITNYPSNAGGGCYVAWSRASGYFYLANDAGTAWLGPLTLGSSDTLQNSQCILYGTGSSVTTAFTQVTMTMQISFTAAFAGTRGMYLWAYGTQGDSSAIQQFGSWTVNATAYPDLTIAKSHAGNFTQGQTGAAYTITATNSGSGITSGMVTVIDTLPSPLTASGMSGSGWSCNVSTVTCTRSDTLAVGASYPAITLTVNVASNAPASVTNTASVSGGGETNTSNDGASDLTTISGSGGGSSNLALNKAATQSSTYADTPPRAASLAVDGNTDGNYYDGSVSTTNYDQNAWWQVDLGSSATVSSVVVWNRTDCCNPSRLADYWIFVSNTPFLSTDTPGTLQNRAGTWNSHQTTTPSPSTTVSLGGYSGRYVRVQLSGQNYLSLAEVQVFGTAGGLTPDLTVTMNHTPSPFFRGRPGPTTSWLPIPGADRPAGR